MSAAGSIALVADNAATATLSGATPALTAQLARSADLQAQNLSAASAMITASASANAQVCATSSLNATLSTSSHVGYHCNSASVTKNVDQTSTLTME